MFTACCKNGFALRIVPLFELFGLTAAQTQVALSLSARLYLCLTLGESLSWTSPLCFCV